MVILGFLLIWYSFLVHLTAATMLSADDTTSSSTDPHRGFRKDEVDKIEYRSNASQPLPIIRTSNHKHAAHDKEENDYDDDNDQGLFSSSPLLFAVSTFSEWGTESATTDEGAESDPFCYDDEAFHATIHGKPLPAKEIKEDTTITITPPASSIEVTGNPPLKPVACVQENFVGRENEAVLVAVKSKSMLKRWAKAVWGAVTKIFSRRGKGRIREGKTQKQN